MGYYSRPRAVVTKWEPRGKINFVVVLMSNSGWRPFGFHLRQAEFGKVVLTAL